MQLLEHKIRHAVHRLVPEARVSIKTGSPHADILGQAIPRFSQQHILSIHRGEEAPDVAVDGDEEMLQQVRLIHSKSAEHRRAAHGSAARPPEVRKKTGHHPLIRRQVQGPLCLEELRRKPNVSLLFDLVGTRLLVDEVDRYVLPRRRLGAHSVRVGCAHRDLSLIDAQLQGTWGKFDQLLGHPVNGGSLVATESMRVHAEPIVEGNRVRHRPRLAVGAVEEHLMGWHEGSVKTSSALGRDTSAGVGVIYGAKDGADASTYRSRVRDPLLRRVVVNEVAVHASLSATTGTTVDDVHDGCALGGRITRVLRVLISLPHQRVLGTSKLVIRSGVVRASGLQVRHGEDEPVACATHTAVPMPEQVLQSAVQRAIVPSHVGGRGGVEQLAENGGGKAGTCGRVSVRPHTSSTVHARHGSREVRAR